jgi:hypothetical protein
VKFTPEQLQQLEERNLANIVLKLNKNKTLTRAEAELLRAHKEGGVKTTEPEYADTWDELAVILGRSRRTLQKWRKRFGKKCPKDRADGRKSVKLWRKFMVDNDLADEPDLPEDDQPSKADWDRERSRIDFQATLFRLEKERGRHVELAEICAAVGQMLAGFRTAVNMLPGSAARWLIGLKDFHSIKTRLQSEVDGVLQSLGRHEFMYDLAPVIVEQEFPKETPEIRQKLTEGLRHCFVQWGRTALSDLMQREFVEHQ